MRRSFDGLAMMTTTIIRQDPYAGHIFVFRNRNGDKLKLLYWDRDGYALWYKRLEKGRFQFPAIDGDQIEIETTELSMLLEGIDLIHSKRHKRYRRH
jgi:transposase